MADAGLPFVRRFACKQGRDTSMPYAAADVGRACVNLEHGDCYRGCFVDEKIVVVRCAQKTEVGLRVKHCTVGCCILEF
jgi:hypothetical protein